MAAKYAVDRLRVPECRACKVIGVSRAVYKYTLKLDPFSGQVRNRVIELPCLYGRYGYRKITEILKFVAKKLLEWFKTLGISPLFIQPGNPWENGYSESFNGKMRYEPKDNSKLQYLLFSWITITYFGDFEPTKLSGFCKTPLAEKKVKVGGSLAKTFRENSLPERVFLVLLLIFPSILSCCTRLFSIPVNSLLITLSFIPLFCNIIILILGKISKRLTVI